MNHIEFTLEQTIQTVTIILYTNEFRTSKTLWTTVPFTRMRTIGKA
jgi:hypothetical protein